MNYSPIALFVYKRPEHTRNMLENLMRCPEFIDSPVYVFCDGAKTSQDIDYVQKTRDLVKSMVSNHSKVTMVESKSNKGLAASIISGVKQVFQDYEKIIVVEDDLIVSAGFLDFLNQGLEKYKNESKVMQISAHMFNVPQFLDKVDTLFLPFGTSWGWGTWKRAWQHFDPQASGWEVLNHNREMRYRFNLNNHYDYFSMLERQMAGKIDSWAVRWYWSMFKLNGYCLFPPTSYVNNIGFDRTATHGYLSAKLSLNPIFESMRDNTSPSLIFPTSIDIKEDDFNAVITTMGRSTSWPVNLVKKIRDFLNDFVLSR